MTAADEAYRPPHGLLDYFAGAWSYLRQLDDRRLATQGSILGIAHFLPDGDGLVYRERGRLVLAGTETTATRRYGYRFAGNGCAQVFFADGRPFHEMDLTAGTDRFRHHCSPDLYEGRCRLSGAHAWQLEWRVTGPRKDLRLTTFYRRFADCCPPAGVA